LSTAGSFHDGERHHLQVGATTDGTLGQIGAHPLVTAYSAPKPNVSGCGFSSKIIDFPTVRASDIQWH